MEVMLIEARTEKDIELDVETILKCKKYKKIALYSSIQFVRNLGKVIKQLEKEGIKVISSKPERASAKYQILGCDADYPNLNLCEEPDAFLYIGDGLFHPQTLAIAQRNNPEFKDVIIFNPFTEASSIIEEDDVKKMLRKYKSSLIKFVGSEIIGVIVTTKPGQEQYKASKMLIEKYPDKKFYYFLDNDLDLGRLEDFPFVDVWVNTACPRLGFEDNAHIPISMINLNDALDGKELICQEYLLTRS